MSNSAAPAAGPTGAGIDPGEFRTALGRFATGVTVVTARAPDGQRVGVTANSFNSVSLEPPLVLWSLARSSKSLPLFNAAGHFCVNVLAENQVELSLHFAASKRDKFAAVDYRDGELGDPVLDGCSANFQCRTAFTYEGGDHLIFVGEVVAFDHRAGPGLLYHHGRYATSREHPGFKPDADRAHSRQAGQDGFVDDYLDYLLSTAADCVQRQFQEDLDRSGRGKSEWRVLAVLNDEGEIGHDILSAKTLVEPDSLSGVTAGLVAEGLISCRGDAGSETFSLTAEGGKVVEGLLAAAEAKEAGLLEVLGPSGAKDLKQTLKTLISSVS